MDRPLYSALMRLYRRHEVASQPETFQEEAAQDARLYDDKIKH